MAKENRCIRWFSGLRDRCQQYQHGQYDRTAIFDKLTIRVSREVRGRVRNAACWNPRLTVAAITQLGLKLALENIERDGGRYPPRETKLRGGSRVK